MLVVGGGNTGYQIAEELARTQNVRLSIGARQTPLPQRILGRDLFRYLEATGLMGKTVESRIGRRMQHRETLIGSSLAPPDAGTASSARANRRRVRVRGSLQRRWPAQSRCGHLGDRLRARPLVRAAARLRHGRPPLHQRGVTASPGLYFLGMPWQHTRGSALLGGSRIYAQYIADQIATHAGTGTSPAAPALAAEPPQR